MSLPIHPVTRPASLAGKTNGKLSKADLVTVPGQAGGFDITLVAPAARAWMALTAALAAEGHILKVGFATASYRPYSDQERIFRARYVVSVLGNRRWQGKRWRKRAGVPAAAVPGTSNHGWGLAVDVGEERDGDAGTERLGAGTLAALKVHAHRFGFSWELQSEPWHLRYWAGDNIPQAVLAYEATTRGTNRMYMIRLPDGAYRVVLPEMGHIDVTKPDHWAEVIRNGNISGIYESPNMAALLDPSRFVDPDDEIVRAVGEIGPFEPSAARTPVEIDYAKLAAAVNDDAARRMRE